MRDVDAGGDRSGESIWGAAAMACGRGYGVFPDPQRWRASGAMRWGAGGVSAARERECAGVSPGGRAGTWAGGAGAGDVSWGTGTRGLGGGFAWARGDADLDSERVCGGRERDGAG